MGTVLKGLTYPRIGGVGADQPRPRFFITQVLDEGTAVALSYGILKGGLPGPDAERPLTVAFVDIGHSCTQVSE